MCGVNKKFRLSTLAAAMLASVIVPGGINAASAGTVTNAGSDYSAADTLYKQGHASVLSADQVYGREAALDFDYPSLTLPSGITKVFVQNNSMSAESGSTVNELYTVYGIAALSEGTNNSNTLELNGATVLSKAANVWAEGADTINFSGNTTTVRSQSNVVDLAGLAGTAVHGLSLFSNNLVISDSTVSNISSLYVTGESASIGAAGQANITKVSDTVWNVNNYAENTQASTFFGTYIKTKKGVTADSNEYTLNNVTTNNSSQNGEAIHIHANVGDSSTFQNNKTTVMSGSYDLNYLLMSGVWATTSKGSLNMKDNVMTANTHINAEGLFLISTWGISPDGVNSTGSTLSIDGAVINASTIGVVAASVANSAQCGAVNQTNLTISNSNLMLPANGEGMGYVTAVMLKGNAGTNNAYLSEGTTLSISNSTVKADIVAAVFGETSANAAFNNTVNLDNAKIIAPIGLYGFAALDASSSAGYAAVSVPSTLNITGVNLVDGPVNGFGTINAAVHEENANDYVLTSTQPIDLSNTFVNISSPQELGADHYWVIQAPSIKFDNSYLTITSQYIKDRYFIRHGPETDNMTMTNLWIDKFRAWGTVSRDSDDSGDGSGGTSAGKDSGSTASGSDGKSGTGAEGTGDKTGSGTADKDKGDSSSASDKDTASSATESDDGTTKRITVTGSDGKEKTTTISSSSDGTKTITDSDGTKHTASVSTDSDGTKHVTVKDENGKTEKTAKVTTDSDGTQHITVNDASGKKEKSITVKENSDGTKTASVTDKDGNTKTIHIDKTSTSTTEQVPLDSLPGVIHTREAKESTKMLADAALGAGVSVAEAAGFLSDDGMDAVLNSIRLGKDLFGVARVGDSKYRAHQDVSVVNSMFVMGFAHKIGNTAVAGFIDGGFGRVRSYWTDYSGRSNFYSYGIGAAVRHNFGSPFYAEGLVRIGQLHNKYGAVIDSESSRYTTNSFYVSGHVGVGYVFDLSEKNSLDVYTKYLVTRLGSDSAQLGGTSSASLHINATTTQASRTGVRLRTNWTKTVQTTLGAAYQRNFDGKVKTSIEGVNLDVPMYKGNTGIGEVGVKFVPSEVSPWTVNMNFKGYVGERRGVSATAVIDYRF
jgi:hypothetical protein